MARIGDVSTRDSIGFVVLYQSNNGSLQESIGNVSKCAGLISGVTSQPAYLSAFTYNGSRILLDSNIEEESNSSGVESLTIRPSSTTIIRSTSQYRTSSRRCSIMIVVVFVSF